MKKIKVCYVISSLNKEGPVNVLFNIVSHLDSSKFDIHIVTLNPEKGDSIIDSFNKLPLTIHQLNLKSKSKIPPISRFKNIVRKILPDIIHSHCLQSLLLNFLFTKKNSVHTVHIYPGIQTIKKKGMFLGTILAFINKFLTKAIKHPVACSKSIADMFFETDNYKMRHIQNGVNNQKTKIYRKNQLRDKYNLDQNKTYFVTAGRFSAEKNFKFLINSFSEIREKNIYLLILGDGPLFAELKECKCSNIIFVGFTQNVLDYLQASDYYVSSSITEGLPMSVLEAISTGLPLLLSDIPSHKEILTKDQLGKTGFIYKNNNLHSFSKYLNKLIINDYKKMQNSCKTLYNNNFTSAIMSKKYAQFYFEITT